MLLNEWDTAFSYTLTVLQPNTTYQYRAFHDHVGMYYTNRWGSLSSVWGAEVSFTTSNCTTHTAIDTTICYNASFNGRRYTSDQQLTNTYTPAGRCDSVVTVNLHVLPQRLGNDTVVLCYGDEYDGAPQYSSRTITQTIREDGMCDSTVQVRLQVHPRIASSFTDTLHDGNYRWDDEALTAPGTYTHVYAAANGCDSSVVLHLVAEKKPAGIDDVEHHIAIAVSGSNIIVAGAEGRTVQLLDVAGRLLAIRQESADPVVFRAPASGTYFVKVADLPARRVVVAR